jgi:glutathione S-transferase
MLGQKAEFKELDLLKGEHKRPEYLAINPSGQVPALVDGENVITDSATILVYLAMKYGDSEWFPGDLLGKAEVYKWFTAVGDGVDQGTFAARMVKKFGAPYDYEPSVKRGIALLKKLDLHFHTNEWLVGSKISVADLHMYPYTRLAEEGGIDLSPYTKVQQWFERIEDAPGYVKIDQ